LVAINELAVKHFRDERLSMKGIPPKLRQITDAYLVSQGIDVKVKPISILDEDFQKNVKKHGRVRTKAAAIEHAVRNHLDVDLNDDPELQASFADALAQIFLDFAKNWAKIYEELEKLRQRIINASQEPTYGLSKKKQMPFFRMLRKETFGEVPAVNGLIASERLPAHLGWTEESQISALVALTQHVYAEIERELKMTGFWESIPARNKLVADLQKTLLQPEFIKLPHLAANRKHIISRMMEIAEKNNDLIQFAKE
jgi:type I restriction enzyme R subunit